MEVEAPQKTKKKTKSEDILKLYSSLNDKDKLYISNLINQRFDFYKTHGLVLPQQLPSEASYENEQPPRERPKNQGR